MRQKDELIGIMGPLSQSAENRGGLHRTPPRHERGETSYPVLSISTVNIFRGSRFTAPHQSQCDRLARGLVIWLMTAKS